MKLKRPEKTLTTQNDIYILKDSKCRISFALIKYNVYRAQTENVYVTDIFFYK